MFRCVSEGNFEAHRLFVIELIPSSSLGGLAISSGASCQPCKSLSNHYFPVPSNTSLATLLITMSLNRLPFDQWHASHPSKPSSPGHPSVNSGVGREKTSYTKCGAAVRSGVLQGPISALF